eukprot:616001_1
MFSKRESKSFLLPKKKKKHANIAWYTAGDTKDTFEKAVSCVKKLFKTNFIRSKTIYEGLPANHMAFLTLYLNGEAMNSDEIKEFAKEQWNVNFAKKIMFESIEKLPNFALCWR